MQCPKCNCENELGAAFCANCGAPIPAMEPTAPSVAENAPAVQFCRQCGTPVADRFCAECGTSVDEQDTGAADTASKAVDLSAVGGAINTAKTKFGKKLALVAILLAVVAVMVIASISVLGGSNFSVQKNSISFFPDHDVIAVSGNNNAKFTISGTMESHKTSLDGGTVALMTDYNRRGGTLWLVTTSEAARIADDVTEYIVADSGKTILYMADYEPDDDTISLYLYDVSSKASSRVAKGISNDAAGFMGLTMLSISPDGKSFGYIGDADLRAGEFFGYVVINGGAPERFGKNMVPLLISDGGKYIYYLKAEENLRNAALFVKNGNNDQKLADNVFDFYGATFLNADYSEILFAYNDRTQLSRNGGERERVASNAPRSLVTPQNAQAVANLAVVYGTKSFAGTVLRTGEGYEYIDNNFEGRRIPGTDSVRESSLSDDGKTLYYISSNYRLFRLNPTRANEERVEIARDVSRFGISRDGNNVYYIDEDDDLWFLKSGNDPSRISMDVHTFVQSADTKNLFYIADYSSRNSSGDLYHSTGGKNGTRIANDIKRVWSTPTSVFYENTDGDIYRSNGNAKFELFVRG